MDPPGSAQLEPGAGPFTALTLDRKTDRSARNVFELRRFMNSADRNGLQVTALAGI